MCHFRAAHCLRNYLSISLVCSRVLWCRSLVPTQLGWKLLDLQPGCVFVWGVGKDTQRKRRKGPLSVGSTVGPVSSGQRVPTMINSQFSGWRPCLGGSLGARGSLGEGGYTFFCPLLGLPSTFSSKCHRTPDHASQFHTETSRSCFA